MTYGVEEIKETERVINSTFHIASIIGVYTFCILLILLGIYLNNALGFILIATGCLAITQVNLPSQIKIRNTIAALNGRNIIADYSFYHNYFTCKTVQGIQTINYSAIIKIVDGGRYLYLFTDRSKAYVLDSETLDNLLEFKEFINQITGLNWERPISSLYSLLKNIRGKSYKE